MPGVSIGCLVRQAGEVDGVAEPPLCHPVVVIGPPQDIYVVELSLGQLRLHGAGHLWEGRVDVHGHGESGLARGRQGMIGRGPARGRSIRSSLRSSSGGDAPGSPNNASGGRQQPAPRDQPLVIRPTWNRGCGRCGAASVPRIAAHVITSVSRSPRGLLAPRRRGTVSRRRGPTPRATAAARHGCFRDSTCKGFTNNLAGPSV